MDNSDATQIAAVPVNGQPWPPFKLRFIVPFAFETCEYPDGVNPQEAIQAEDMPLDFALIESEVAALLQEQGLAMQAEFGDDVLRVEAMYDGLGNRIVFAGDGSLPPPYHGDGDASAFMREAAHLIAAVVNADGLKDLVTIIDEAKVLASKYEIDTEAPWSDVGEVVDEIVFRQSLAVTHEAAPKLTDNLPTKGS